MLQEASPAKQAFNTFINTCREGTLRSPAAEHCSFYIRMNLIDEKADTAVSDSARREFNIAEKEFGKSNYSRAIEHYLKAIALEPGYFKARLYLGDAYYANKEYVGAIRYFKEATQVKPNQQEAWKYLTDAYYHTGAHAEALKACIEGILIYPDVGMFFKLEDAYKVNGKNFDRKWMERKVFPKLDSLNLAQKIKDKDWRVYLAALKEIRPYCNKQGIVTRSNDLTRRMYADVYAFEKMVSQSTAPEFDFARQMITKDYLDCYVLFSLYHYDVNAQYKHFAAQNKEKLKDYIAYLSN
jgi:tetratricopeptide (TPR) repeat protein